MAHDSDTLARAWLEKACSDLASAKLLASADAPLLDTAAFHCQQAGEKSLKAFLTAAEIPFPKTHLLDSLLALCAGRDASFDSLREQCLVLTPLATEFRYPGDVFQPTHAEVSTAMAMAKEIVGFVTCRLGRRRTR